MAKLLEHRHAGAVLALLGDGSFVALDALTQVMELDYGVPVGEILFARMSITTVFCIVILLQQGRSDELRQVFNLSTSSLWWARGVVCSIQMTCFFSSLRFLPLSETNSIFHLRPVGVAVLCTVWLGEPYHISQVIACIVSFGGVLLVVQPDFIFHHGEGADRASADITIGVVLALTSMFFAAFDFALVRKIGNAASSVVLCLIYSVCTAAVGIFLAFFPWDRFIWLSGRLWFFVLTVTVVGLLAQNAQVMALQRETGTFVALLAYFGIVHAVNLQWLIYGTTPNLLGIAGMAMVVIAGCCTILFKPQPKDSETASTEVHEQAESEIRMGLLSDTHESSGLEAAPAHGEQEDKPTTHAYA